MEPPAQQTSAFKTWLIVLFCVAIVVFQGWLAFTVIGDLGQPDWDYRPIADVPGESAYAVYDPYYALPRRKPEAFVRAAF
jgi:hypothetical protein